jgi:hypothetical protein
VKAAVILAAVVVLVLVLGGLVARLGRLSRAHGGHTLLWRWFSGEPLDGNPRTDAGWMRPGAKALTRSGYASRWAHKRREVRAAWRTGGTLAVLAVAWGLLTHRAATSAVLFGLALAGLGWAGWAAWRGARTFTHRRAWVRPLHLALAPQLGIPLTARPSSWLTVPRDYHRQEGAQVRIDLPPRMTPGAESKRALVSIVREKLALENPRADWHMHGAKPHVMLTVQVPPPDKVTLAAVRQIIEQTPETAPLVGLGRAGKPVYADLDGDSPHLCLSMGSGGGKSVTSRALVAQILAKGGIALVLDVKRLSHAWARGLPNVRYCRDIIEIHDALLWLSAEVDRRNKLADEGSDTDGNTDHVDVGPRIVVIAEELNATTNRLRSYWRKIKDKSDPAESPAVEALGDALFMGRQVKINVCAIAQMLTARTAGGPEARENMGVRILARYSVNNWRMLIPEVWPAPKSSRHRGRVQVCVSGDVAETQVLFMSAAEARELATSGTVARFPSFDGAAVGGDGAAAPARFTVVPNSRPVGLGDAVNQGLVPLTLDALRKARQRDPEFPPVRGQRGSEFLYDPAELAAWSRNRPRAAAEGAEADKVSA